MRNDERRTRGREAGHAWPGYLEPLRPDEVARHRMRKRILAAAETLLERRPPTWFDVTATWSSVLAPLAAGLLVVFGTLAYRASTPPAEPQVAVEPSEPVGLVPSLAPDAQALPTILTDTDEPSRDDVLAAVLIADR